MENTSPSHAHASASMSTVAAAVPAAESSVPSSLWASVLSGFLTVAQLAAASQVNQRWRSCFSLTSPKAQRPTASKPNQQIEADNASSVAGSAFASSSLSVSSSSPLLSSMLNRELRRMAIATIHQPFATHSTGDPAYDPATSIDQGCGLPENPQLRFWRVGNGWRNWNMGDVESGVEYFVFEPRTLEISDGVLHTAELAAALYDAQSVDELQMTDKLKSWRDLKYQWLEEAKADAAANYSQEDVHVENSGSGDAENIANSMALQEPSPQLCYAAEISLPPLPPLRDWSAKRVQTFLFAWQHVQRVSAIMSKDQARCYLNLFGEDVNMPRTNFFSEVTIPLVFLLPWPTEEDVEPESPISLNSFDNTVAGCRWPKPDDADSASSYDAWNGTFTVIGCRVAKLLHLHKGLSDVVRPRPATYFPGKRPIHSTEDCPAEYPLDKYLPDMSDDTLNAVAGLLQHSFLFSLGSEHLMPWPSILIAPIAPGWVAGIMGGGNYLD